MGGDAVRVEAQRGRILLHRLLRFALLSEDLPEVDAGLGELGAVGDLDGVPGLARSSI